MYPCIRIAIVAPACSQTAEGVKRREFKQIQILPMKGLRIRSAPLGKV